MNQTAEQVLNEILDTKPDTEVRIARLLAVGQGIHQGDIYMIRVDDDHPRGTLRGSRQVAVGDTIGSRHIVEGDVTVYEGVRLPSCMKVPSNELSARLGPVVVAPSGCVLTHPEHAYHDIRQGGTYQVVYQLDMVTRHRVAD